MEWPILRAVGKYRKSLKVMKYMIFSEFGTNFRIKYETTYGIVYEVNNVRFRDSGVSRI